ncbi:MAG: glutamate-cysteine ligase family protein [Nitrospirota bacterium]|jgi:gamma-glutamyl:cysteine ligase YbdK (ATP-grasp superfamily)
MADHQRRDPGATPPLHLFQGFGIEIEYMIVAVETLDVLPVCDEVLRAVAGEYVSDVEGDDIDWSNELVLHVVELKTAGPAPTLAGLAAKFHRDLQSINRLLASHGGRLMPSAMHPWMDPHSQTQLWSHDYSPVYEAFNRVFDCRGHGWANLQSAHINLPFAGDDEFGRLHAAIRLILPILPAIAASSPLADGRLTGHLDTRLDTYRGNARRVPSVSGRVIPEPVFTKAHYHAEILARIYADISPLDPEGILQHEWLNARGAIARFDRDAIEIRLLDTQECPTADLAVAAAVVAAVRAVAEERWSSFEAQCRFAIEPLDAVLRATIHDGEAAVITDPEYLAALGIDGDRCTAGELWSHLVATCLPANVADNAEWHDALAHIAGQGTLARRIARRVGRSPDHQRLVEVYGELCDCLDGDTLFDGGTDGASRS